VKNITKNELIEAIELLDGAIDAFSQQPYTGLYNKSGICWYVTNTLSHGRTHSFSTSVVRKYRRLICIILNIESIRETNDFMFGGGKTQRTIYKDCPNKKYERRDFCINRLKELETQLNKRKNK